MNTNNLTWAITFQWNDAENVKLQKQISQKQVSKHHGVIIIGRDPNVCDLVLNNQSISSHQAEIYFDKEQQVFFIKNKNAVHTTIVDGNVLAFDKELPFNNGSIIIIGQEQIEITEIKIYTLPSTNYSSVHTNIDPLINNAKSANTNSNPIPVSSSTVSQKDKTKSWRDKKVITAIITVVTAGITAISGYKQTQDTKVSENHKLYLDRFIKHREKVASLREKNSAYNKLKLINNCPQSVSVAASFYALDDVMETKGWLNIKSQEKINPDYLTTYNAIFLYAFITNKNGKQIVWKDDQFVSKSITKKREFNYIEEPFLKPDIPKESVKFYQVKFNPQADGYTTKTFTCDDEDKLELK